MAFLPMLNMIDRAKKSTMRRMRQQKILLQIFEMTKISKWEIRRKNGQQHISQRSWLNYVKHFGIKILKKTEIKLILFRDAMNQILRKKKKKKITVAEKRKTNERRWRVIPQIWIFVVWRYRFVVFYDLRFFSFFNVFFCTVPIWSFFRFPNGSLNIWISWIF